MNGWFDVTDYGAVGDGATDDSVAIGNAQGDALTAKGTLYFPPGTYLFGGSTWAIDTSSFRFSIVGSGMGSTILKNNSATAGMLHIAGAYDSIENLTIDNNSSTGTALKVNSEYGVVRNIEVLGQAGSNYAVNIDGPTLSVFENILIAGCSNGMIIGETYPTNSVNLRQVSIVDLTGAYGLRMNQCSNVKFFGLYIEPGATNSILIENSQQLDFFSLASEMGGFDFTGTTYFYIKDSQCVNFFGARISHENGPGDRVIFRIEACESVNFNGMYLLNGTSDYGETRYIVCFYTVSSPTNLNFTNIVTAFPLGSAFWGIVNYDAAYQQTVMNWSKHASTEEAVHVFHSGGTWMGLNVDGTITNNASAMINAPVLPTGASKTVDDVIAALQALRLVNQS